MILVIMGLFSFLLFGIYDINQVQWNKKPLDLLFFIGILILVISTCWLIVSSEVFLETSKLQIMALIISGVFFLLLGYSLFVAIPFSNTYLSETDNNSKKVCDQGMYALCRHPGLLWFTCAYMFLALGIQSTAAILMVAVFIVCNFLYVFLQDRWTFPHVFEDYEGYKKSVPFLIPTATSISRSFLTRRKEK